MSKPNWKKAPRLATHVITTGPKWGGGEDYIGRIVFVTLTNGKYFDAGDVKDDDGWYCMGKSSWVVIEERPNVKV